MIEAVSNSPKELLGGVFFLGGFALLLLYLVGHLIKMIWKEWIDRGESEIPHIFDLIIPTWSVVSPDNRGLRKDSFSTNVSDGDADIFLTRGGARKALEGLNTYVSEGAEVQLGQNAWLKGLMLWSVMVATVAVFIFFIEAPTITLWTGSILCGLFMARYLRDGQKAVKKLSKAITEHANDKDAHTDNAKDIDTDIGPVGKL